MNDCHHDDHASTAPAIAAFLVLIVFGLAVRYWMWVAAGVGILVLGAVLWPAFYAARRVDAKRAARAALVRDHAATLPDPIPQHQSRTTSRANLGGLGANTCPLWSHKVAVGRARSAPLAGERNGLAGRTINAQLEDIWT